MNSETPGRAGRPNDRRGRGGGRATDRGGTADRGRSQQRGAARQWRSRGEPGGDGDRRGGWRAGGDRREGTAGRAGRESPWGENQRRENPRREKSWPESSRRENPGRENPGRGPRQPAREEWRRADRRDDRLRGDRRDDRLRGDRRDDRLRGDRRDEPRRERPASDRPTRPRRDTWQERGEGPRTGQHREPGRDRAPARDRTPARDRAPRDRAPRDQAPWRDGGREPRPGYDRRPGRPTGDRRFRPERPAAETRRGPRPARAGEAPAQAPPELAADIEARDLDPAARAQLNALHRPVAETVARHLIASGRLLEEDPPQALAHALAARRLAARAPAVREAAGLAAYRAGQYSTALAELRAYHRMSGTLSHLAVLADAERALGRPERAIDLFRTTDRKRLDRGAAIELLIVAAGARRDLGQGDAAVAMLQIPELDADTDEPWLARLRYAYADALLGLDRRDEARRWFARAAEVDEDLRTDAAERLLELDGVVLREVPDEGVGAEDAVE